jgi:hypothetical protein
MKPFVYETQPVRVVFERGALARLRGEVERPGLKRVLGLRERQLDGAAELATRNPYDNPRPVTRDGIRALLDDAFHGRRPREPGATPAAARAHRTLDLERRGHA